MDTKDKKNIFFFFFLYNFKLKIRNSINKKKNKILKFYIFYYENFFVGDIILRFIFNIIKKT